MRHAAQTAHPAARLERARFSATAAAKPRELNWTIASLRTRRAETTRITSCVIFHYFLHHIVRVPAALFNQLSVARDRSHDASCSPLAALFSSTLALTLTAADPPSSAAPSSLRRPRGSHR